jgi:hypothetical protein
LLRWDPVDSHLTFNLKKIFYFRCILFFVLSVCESINVSSSSSSYTNDSGIASLVQPAASASFVKVSHQIGAQNLLSRAPSCFGRHVKLLGPTTFAVSTSFQGGWTSGRRPVVKIIAESLSQQDEKHV